MYVAAIGDVHGCAAKLVKLLEALFKWSESAVGGSLQLVFLGDLINRGPDSASCVQTVRQLQLSGAICLRGNHEQLAVDAASSEYSRVVFEYNGGLSTIKSFRSAQAFEEARSWMASLPTYYEDDLRYFVHAGVDPAVALADQTDSDRLWIRGPFLRHTEPFEKYVVHGHTPTVTLTPWRDTPDIRHNRTNLDTGAVFGGKLSAGIFDRYQKEPIHTISV